MTTKAFRELKEEILRRNGNVRFTDKLLENLTEKQVKNLLNFYLDNIKLDSDLKQKNVDILEDIIASSIVEEEEKDSQEVKKIALNKKSSNKKVKKEDAKKENKKEVKNIVIDINTLKRGDKILVIDEKDNFSIVEIRDVEPDFGILGRDVDDLANCFSISKTELAQGFYIHNKKQYFVKPYRG